jgi:mono/diheme cytochrome c family protein
MRNVYLVTTFVVVLTVSLLGFRGTNFTAPPMDVFPEWAFPGMKYQPKLRPQATSAFFADGRADRLPPPNVVRADLPLRNDDSLYAGKTARGEFVRGYPAAVTVDLALLERGRDRYEIYCAPCHGTTGDGNGITKQYGMGATPNYHDDRLRKMAEGEIYNTITVGKGNMLSYADKLTPDERWAVIAYVRALQRAQTGTVADALGSSRAGEVEKAKKELNLP